MACSNTGSSIVGASLVRKAGMTSVAESAGERAGTSVRLVRSRSPCFSTRCHDASPSTSAIGTPAPMTSHGESAPSHASVCSTGKPYRNTPKLATVSQFGRHRNRGSFVPIVRIAYGTVSARVMSATGLG